jgi:hypothetical protein
VSDLHRRGADLALAAALLLARAPRRYDPSERARRKAQADAEDCLAIAERIVAASTADSPVSDADLEQLRRLRRRLPRAGWAQQHATTVDRWIARCEALETAASRPAPPTGSGSRVH